MTFQQDNATYTIPTGDHLLTVRNRKRMDVTSVKSIERFDQEEFFVLTSQGHLQIRGEDLRIVHLDVDKGLLTLEGTVKNLQYDEEDSGLSRSILHKLFG
ncbi:MULTISPECIES: sporulation protein YabP [unclassified Rummeliibacillus]|jgi:sporulation protein YabP|uniref:sporulation protein YabP n=1 Tax=unclassified Rummeliibacillus TaxID=2622809 RepID=UPI000E674748|nr:MULTISPECIES: sporulation protein YabP [unclassified Rummeliibacillus]RIJ64325.1 sporulation protein YabP [Rummeliibacillus sp. POC4]RPJ94653.1 sporulation protein YabP [Rummeliibacillus sp. TYF005]